MWLVLVCVATLVMLFVCFCCFLFCLTWEPFCLFCLGKSLEVGVVSVTVYMEKEYLRDFFDFVFIWGEVIGGSPFSLFWDAS